MLEKIVRPTYQRFLVDPFVRLLPLSPLYVTFAGCLLGVLAAVAIPLGAPWIAIALLLLSGYCDTLDGTLARRRGVTSPLGSVLDIVSDRIVEAAMIIGLFAVAPHERALVSLAMMASILICITSFLVVGIFIENESEKGFHYSPGLMQRAEAFLFFIAMILFPSLAIFLGWVFTFLVFLTATLRLLQFKKHQ